MQYFHDLAGKALLARAVDEAAFLDALQQAYGDIGLPSLDFAAVRAYWHGAAPLPGDWRRALARPRLDAAGTRRWLDPALLVTLQTWLLPGRNPVEWSARGERAVVLLAPVLPPEVMAELLTPLPGESLPRGELAEFYAAKGVLQLDPVELYAAKVAAVQEWLRQLQQAQGDWAAAAALYRDSGVDTALPARIVASVSAAQWREDSSATRRSLILLNRLHATAILLREHLHFAVAMDGDWALALLHGFAHFAALERERQQFAPDAVSELVLALLRPLCVAAAQAPGRDEYLRNASAHERRALTWTGLVHALAEPPSRWQQFLQQSSLSLLRYLGLGDAHGFAPRFPQQALDYEQWLWAQDRWFDGGLCGDPQAIAWYGRILDEISDELRFERGFVHIVRHAGEARLRELLQRHVFDRGRAVPQQVWALVHGVELLEYYISDADGAAAQGAASRLAWLALAAHGETTPPREPYWSALQRLGERKPDLCAQFTVSAVHAAADSMARWQALWLASRDEKSRRNIAGALLDAVAAAASVAAAQGLAETLYASERALFASHATSDRFGALGFCAALQAGNSPLRELVVPALAHLMARSGGSVRPTPEQLRPALLAYPQQFAALEQKHRLRLLPLLDADGVAACGAGLAATLREANKLGRTAVRNLLARTPVAALRRSGLLDETDATARLAVLTALAQNSDSEAVALIADCVADPAHDDYSRGLSLDALARSGHSLRGLDDWAGASQEEMQVLAAAQKIPPALAKAWNEDTARLLAPLGETLGKYLLWVLQLAGDALPRRARQILALLPPARRSDLAAYGVKTWVAEQGVDKFNWLLLPLPDYGDERVVGDLLRGAKAWAAKRKLKAVAALQLLCRLPGVYGAAQVRDLWESGKLSPFVRNAAIDALEEAAQERGLSREDFLERLVPDFGFGTDGLRLDLGQQVVTARLYGDFSLQLYDAAGKACKSLPRAKAGEDADRRGLAENQLKMLAKNLKPLYRQQLQKLQRALQTGRLWDAPQWRTLFVEHALLRVLGQVLVWSVVDAEEQSLARFRPNASGELVDAGDSAHALAADLRVRLAHPLEMAPGEADAWSAQFADYELISPLEQLQLPVFAAQPQELARARIDRADGSRLLRGRFAALMEKWNYLKDESSDRVVCSHSWQVAPWRLVIGHSAVSAVFDLRDEVVIDGLRILRRGEGQPPESPATLAELPAALRATLLAQAEALKAAAL